ncbi:MAG: hypothetical protein WCX95_00010 [Candidatus Gracilibacteria bacterium]
MIHSELEKFLKTLTCDACPIVIDCGHVDTKEIKPRIADGFTLSEGLECLKILKQANINPVKISILFNDTYLLQNSSSITEGRKQIRRLRSEIKSKGIHHMLLDIYKKPFEEHGIFQKENFFKSEFLYLSENSLILQSRQEIERYHNNQNSFKKQLISIEKGLKFRMQNSEEVDIAYEHNGAPGWPLVSANIVNFFEKQEFKTIICLRDIHWAPRVKTGGLVAKELYGCKIKTHAFFYEVKDNSIVAVD